MKKELFIASLFAATSVFATGLESNSMSVLPDVTPPHTTVSEGRHLMLLTAPFAGYGALENITVSDVIITNDLKVGDVLYIQDSTKGTYNRYTLGAGGWVQAKQITIDSSGARTEGSLSPDVAAIQRGKPFWLETEATSVTLLGETLDSQTPVSVSTSREAYALVAPTTAETPVQLTGASAIGESGDRILFADGTMYLKNGTKWVQLKPTKSETLSKGEIPVGVGFWYMSKDGNSITL